MPSEMAAGASEIGMGACSTDSVGGESLCEPLTMKLEAVSQRPTQPHQIRVPLMDVLHVEEDLQRMMAIPVDFLADEEEETLEEFCGDIARIRRLNDRDASREVAVKFLMARRFDPVRAFTLYQRYRMIRHTYDMDKLRPTEDPLYSELATGKFTFLDCEEVGGEAVAVFDAALHHSSKDAAALKLMIQGLLFQIDEALRSFSTIACGMSLLINMRSAGPGRDDRMVAQRVLDLLQDHYPARVKRIFVIDTPWYLRHAYRFLSPFMKQKMRERVFLVRAVDLQEYFPKEVLPVSLGGTRLSQHSVWLTRAIHHYQYIIGSRPYAMRNSAMFSTKSCRAARSIVVDGGSKAGRKKSKAAISPTASLKLNLAPLAEEEPRRNSCIVVNVPEFRRDAQAQSVAYLRALHTINGMPLDLLADYLDPEHPHSLFDEFSEIQAAPLQGTYTVGGLPCNTAKNRHADIFCMDDSRVSLMPHYLPSGEVLEGSDYIHANYVTGIHQPNAYILTQSPMASTVGDFWRMIWEQNVHVAVMCNQLAEGTANAQFYQYWPKADGVIRIAAFSLRVTSTSQADGWTKRVISVRRLPCGTVRQLTHFQLTEWSDKGLVKNAIPILEVMLKMHHSNRAAPAAQNSQQSGAPLMTVPQNLRQSCRSLPDESALEDGRLSAGQCGSDTPTPAAAAQKCTNPPILVHCSSGVGRSAALVAADICCAAVLHGSVDVAGTVCHLRTQRVQSVQAFSHYTAVYKAVSEYSRLLQDTESRDERLDALLNDLPVEHSCSWDTSGGFQRLAPLAATTAAEPRVPDNSRAERGGDSQSEADGDIGRHWPPAIPDIPRLP